MRRLSQFKLPTTLSVWALPLLMGVVVLLGYQQYRWIDKVSEVEAKTSRERLDTSLKALANDFDTEITRVHLLFMGLAARSRDAVVQQAQERLLLFRKLSAYPGLIESVSAEEALPPAVRMLDAGPPPALTLPAIFEPPLAPKPETRFVAASGAVFAVAKERFQPGIREPMQISIGAPVQIRVMLNQAYIGSVLIPELLKRHFGPNPERHYDVLIRSATENTRLLVWGAENQGAWESSIRIFTIRPDCLLGKGNQVFARSFTLARGRRTFFTQTGLSAPSNSADLSSLLRQAENCEDTSDMNSGLWIMNIRSRPSLRAVVDSARRRNLAMSFGVTLALGMGIIVLFVSGQRARELAARHEQFAASVSHELRTPLSVISSASANLTDGVIEHPEQVRQYGGIIHSHSVQLSAMIENALWFAQRNVRSELEMDAIDVCDLVTAAAATSSRALQQAEMTLEQDIQPGLPCIRGNRVLLLHALENLLANAAIHARSGRWARVRAGREGEKIVFTVEDRGEGISPEEVKRVFEPFYRGKRAHKGKQGGLGLGLTLVRRIVEAHGESVQLRSRRGVGTVVAFAAPICHG